MEGFGQDSQIGRPGQPSEIAPTYVFLASKEAELYRTFGSHFSMSLADSKGFDVLTSPLPQTAKSCIHTRWGQHIIHRTTDGVDLADMCGRD